MTTNNTVNQSAFLRTSRSFPDEVRMLSVEVDRSYLDVSNAVNSRTIGLFPSSKPANSGETWYHSDNRKQQGLRQIYNFTAAGNVPHGINTANVTFTKCSGSFTDGTNWYGCIFASNVAIAGQLSFYVTPTNIVILSGAGAPAVISGIIVLEWITLT